MKAQYNHLPEVTHYWDCVAARYLELFREELRSKPFDRMILREFATDLGHGARVCDAGCGPCAHVTRLLADWGLHMTGVDISPECISLAREEQPSLEFTQADIGDLPVEDGVFDGVVAYYALHYEPRATLSRIIREFTRILRPDGRLLVVAKDGDEERYIDDPLGSGQQVFWCAMPEAELRALIESNDFIVTSSRVREPQTDEIAVRRIYITATRSA